MWKCLQTAASVGVMTCAGCGRRDALLWESGLACHHRTPVALPGWRPRWGPAGSCHVPAQAMPLHPTDHRQSECGASSCLPAACTAQFRLGSAASTQASPVAIRDGIQYRSSFAWAVWLALDVDCAHMQLVGKRAAPPSPCVNCHATGVHFSLQTISSTRTPHTPLAATMAVVGKLMVQSKRAASLYNLDQQPRVRGKP